MARYPLGVWLGNGRTGGSYVGGPARGILHTTETTGLYTDYDGGSKAPHFTVDTDGTVYQHTDTAEASRSLYNGPDPVQTNRQGSRCIQIEIIGRSNQTSWPSSQINGVVALMWWCQEEGVPFVYNMPYGGSEQYGNGNPTEMSIDQWIGFSGWAAHQNVPDGNTHWDIGKYLPVFIQERMKEATQLSSLYDEGAKKGVDDVFAGSWQEMLDEGIFTQFTDPDTAPTAERLAAFFDRLLDEAVERAVAQAKSLVVPAAIAKGTKFEVKVI